MWVKPLVRPPDPDRRRLAGGLQVFSMLLHDCGMYAVRTRSRISSFSLFLFSPGVPSSLVPLLVQNIITPIDRGSM